jgi:hypothetical protein
MGHRFFTQPDAFDGPTISDWKGFITELPDTIGRFQGSIGYLNKALEEMRAALPDVAPHGDYELRYTINRTESYRDYIAALVTMRKAYLILDKAFKDRSKLSHQQFVAELNKALDGFSVSSRQVQAATRKYAEFMDHPSDLGVLYHLWVPEIVAGQFRKFWHGLPFPAMSPPNSDDPSARRVHRGG